MSSVNQSLSNVEWIQKTIAHAFPDAKITVQDTRGDDMHLLICVHSKAFQGKTPIQSHRMIYGCLDDLRRGRIHALSIQALSLT